jgi:hypothetical protein
MKLTDPYVLRQLKLANSSELTELVETYPEDERDGRSDMDILFGETQWLIYKYECDDYGQYWDLNEARKILRETKNGKVMPLENWTWKPKYQPWKIQACKNIVNEYRRLKSLEARLINKHNNEVTI